MKQASFYPVQSKHVYIPRLMILAPDPIRPLMAAMESSGGKPKTRTPFA